MILAMHCVSNDIAGGAIQFERLRRRWTEQKRELKTAVSCFLTAQKFLRIPKILLVVPTNNDCGVLEERLERGISVFDGTKDVWMNVLPICQWFESEEHTPTRVKFCETHAYMCPTLVMDS